MKKNNIKENTSPQENGTTVTIHKKDMNDPTLTKNIQNLGDDVNVNIVDEELDVLDPEAVIAPQDSATIKYLSNVVDDKTGEISQPFTIGAQKYQIIRGLAGDGQIVMAVFAHDETDDEGNNKIYTNEEFENNIAFPARKLQEEGEAMEEPTLRGSNIQVVPEAKKDTYEGRRHFLIKKGTNEVRSFSSIKEMLECGKLEDEQYMGLSEFKKHMNETMFGPSKRKKITELENQNVTQPNAQDSPQPENNTNQKGITYDAEGLPEKINNQVVAPQVKIAIKQMVTRIKGYLDDVNDPKEHIQFLLILTDMLHVGEASEARLSSLIKKTIQPQQQVSQQPIPESKIITKKQLIESLKPKKVIKTIKIKDIK